MTASPAPRANRWLDSLNAYVPGKHGGPGAQNVVRLASNECPFGPNPKAIEAAKSAMGEMHRYADGGANLLREKLCDVFALEFDRVICGTGSDEILQLVPMAFCANGDEVLHSQYGFMMYPIAAKRAGAIPVSVPETDFKTDIDGLLSAVTGKTKVVYIANPNNPTGTRLSAKQIEDLHAGLPSHVLLVLDGAYAEYIDDPEYDGGLALAKSKPNVLMTRTFSKLHGLAGERIGWAYGPQEVINALNKIRGPFNVTAAGQAAALASLEDESWQTHIRAENTRIKSILFDALVALGLKPIPSEVNFLLVQFASADAAAKTVQELAAQGIFVRHLPKMGLTDCIRMGIGTQAENEVLIKALEDIVPGL